MIKSTSEKKPLRTAAERQRKHRESLQAKGLERVSLVLESSAAQRMRDIARDHNVTQAAVFKLGMLAAKRELDGMGKLHVVEAK